MVALAPIAASAETIGIATLPVGAINNLQAQYDLTTHPGTRARLQSQITQHQESAARAEAEAAAAAATGRINPYAGPSGILSVGGDDANDAAAAHARDRRLGDGGGRDRQQQDRDRDTQRAASPEESHPGRGSNLMLGAASTGLARGGWVVHVLSSGKRLPESFKELRGR